MGTVRELRARDALRVPGLISLSRVALAMVFPFVAGSPALAVALMLGAGASDVLDGYLARRRGEETVTGALLDAISDKLFVVSVLVGLLLHSRIHALDVVLFSTRELVEAPVLAWGLLAHAPPGRERRAIGLGKATTLLQFVALLFAIVRLPYVVPMVACAVTGLLAGVTYAAREHAERPARLTK